MCPTTGENSLTAAPNSTLTALPTPTPDTGEDATIDALMRASRVVTGIVVRSMAETESRVTITQLRVLVMVASGSAVTTTAVAAGLQIHLSSASRICDRLVAGEWLERQESPADRRSSLLTLTEQGQSLLDTVMTERRRAFARIIDDIPATHRTALARSLDRFSDAAGEPVTPSLLGRPGGAPPAEPS